MYEIIQIGHLLTFGILLTVPRQRGMSRWLLFSAIVYLLLEPLGTHYVFDIIFDSWIVSRVIRFKSFEAKLQALVLYLLIAFSCLAYLEFPTQLRIIYDSYGIVTNGLNLLQVVIMGSALWDVVSGYISRVDFNCRIVYNLYSQGSAPWGGDMARKEG